MAQKQITKVKILKKAAQPVKVKILKKGNKKPTILQQKVVAIVKGKQGKIKSKAEILREAGASPSVVNNPQWVFNHEYVIKALAETITDMVDVRNNVMAALKGKDMTKESVMSLNFTLKNLNHDIELLSGKPTERLGGELGDDEKAELDRVMMKNRVKSEQ